RLRKAHGGLLIKSLDEPYGEAGIERVAATAGAFHRDIERRHSECQSEAVVIVSSVTAQCEHAGLRTEVEEIPRGVAHIEPDRERPGFLDRGEEVIRVRKNAGNSRHIVGRARKNVDGG